MTISCFDTLQNLPEELYPVVECEGNQNCVDCGAEKPEWGKDDYFYLEQILSGCCPFSAYGDTILIKLVSQHHWLFPW